MDAGRVFQLGIVRGKKLYLKVSVDVEYWMYWSLWDDLGINFAGFKYGFGEIATRSLVMR